MKVKFNSLAGDLRHYHYDVFEIAGEDDTGNRKIAFFADLKGNINSLSVQLEPSVKDIVFTRTASKAMSEKSFLRRHFLSGTQYCVPLFKSILLQLSVGFQLFRSKKEVTSEEFPELVA